MSRDRNFHEGRGLCEQLLAAAILHRGGAAIDDAVPMLVVVAEAVSSCPSSSSYSSSSSSSFVLFFSVACVLFRCLLRLLSCVFFFFFVGLVSLFIMSLSYFVGCFMYVYIVVWPSLGSFCSSAVRWRPARMDIVPRSAVHDVVVVVVAFEFCICADLGCRCGTTGPLR